MHRTSHLVGVQHAPHVTRYGGALIVAIATRCYEGFLRISLDVIITCEAFNQCLFSQLCMMILIAISWLSTATLYVTATQWSPSRQEVRIAQVLTYGSHPLSI